LLIIGQAGAKPIADVKQDAVNVILMNFILILLVP